MTYFVSIHTRSPHPQPVSPPKLFHICEHFSSSYYLKPESLHPKRPQPVRNISSLASSLEFHSKTPAPSGLCIVSSLPHGLLSATSVAHTYSQCLPPRPFFFFLLYQRLYVSILTVPSTSGTVSFLQHLAWFHSCQAPKSFLFFSLFCQ